MATVTPKTLCQGTLLGVAAATLYTTPASTTTTIRSITLCNTDTVTRTVTIYMVASGGAIGDASTVFKTLPILASETITDIALRVLETGDFFSALADAASKVSIRVDGAEIT